jgi:hypothetical protein
MAVDGNDESQATGQPNEAAQQQEHDDSASGPRPPKDADEASFWKNEALQAFRARDEKAAKLREYQSREDKDLAAELAAAKERLAALESSEEEARTQLQEHRRTEVRRRFVDAISTGVPPGMKKMFSLLVAGLEQSGEIGFPDENPEEAAEAVAQKLKDDYPQFFTGDGGPLGRPAGPSGELPEDFNDLTPEQQRNLSDEDFHKHYGAGRKRRKTGRTIFG